MGNCAIWWYQRHESTIPTSLILFCMHVYKLFPKVLPTSPWLGQTCQGRHFKMRVISTLPLPLNTKCIGNRMFHMRVTPIVLIQILSQCLRVWWPKWGSDPHLKGHLACLLSFFYLVGVSSHERWLESPLRVSPLVPGPWAVEPPPSSSSMTVL